MATSPFTAAFVARLENQAQGYRLRCLLGRVVSFKSFCCSSPPLLGVDKPPAAVLDLDPDSQCEATNLSWDVSNSYSPTGTIDTYTISWGDGTTTGPNPWAGPKTGVKQYANAGTYTVKLTVTDTLAVDGTVTYTVEIVDCATDAVLIEQMYALSQTAGPWVRDMTEAVPAWEQRALGLTGNWLNGRAMRLDPHRRHLPYGIRHLWITTQAGPAKSTTDGLFWARLYPRLNEPRNDAGDVPAPTKADLDWFSVAFSPANEDEVYILAGTAARAWLYWTTDGVTFDNWQVRR